MTLRRRRPVPKAPTRSSNLPKPPSVHNPDKAFANGLFVIALITRLFRIQHPAAVVFDELHFGKFLEAHLARRFEFDIHPWLGKLTIALFAYIARFRLTDFGYEIAAVYPNNDYVIARLPGALFGSAIVPLVYQICRELHLSTASSLLGATLPLLDNLLLTESRLILIDAQMMFYLNLSLLLALRVWRLSDSAYGTQRYYSYLLGTAAAAAAAVSVKWTAAVTPFLIICVCGLGIVFLRRPTPLRDCCFAAVIALAIYAIPWYIHLKISTVSTPTAVHMSDRFRSTLKGNDTFPYNPSHNVTFVEGMYELHWKQFRANQKVKTRHHWESRWYEWPLNHRGIYYFVDRASSYTDEKPVIRVIYLLQNPATAIWITASVISFFIILPIVYRYRTMIPKDHPVLGLANKGGFLLAGYVLNLVPFMFVERCYFLYHYLPASAYGQLLAVVLIDAMPTRVKPFGIGAVGVTVLAAFLYWSPWIYCLPIDYEGIARRQWMPRWT